ncbi:hypothetical protein [Pseudothermotoga thermarum]|uniref:Prepilin-type N-terminal cleavage/methylation domain-containing protein n=1 Tax=Pseudothermotoga thermarum DSM 5069 TaxID=688269 RepID=F7YXL5_9THEM|nr:hypothetical protein [Pseudothermotoga thermarum]AEH50656.1 hypothetical protein Theth_0567 [Pseudothermotoga thermarum DSM 5069]
MKGFTVVELVTAMIVLFFAILIIFATVDQAISAFTKANQTFYSTVRYFFEVTSNFAGQPSGEAIGTLSEVLGYQPVGAYRFFDEIEIRKVQDNYVYTLKDLIF